MWRVWRPRFGWESLCPVLFSDPFGLVVVMARASQPVSHEDIVALPDYYPDITSETKVEDHGRIGTTVVVLDYGLPDEDMIQRQRKYYAQKAKS